MSIIFIGGLINPNNMENLVKSSKSSFQFAAQNFQISLIKTIYFTDKDLKLISIPFIGSFPNNSSNIFIKNENYKLFDYIHVSSYGYFNVSFIKFLYFYFLLPIITTSLLIKRNKRIIFVYSAQSYLMLIAIFLKYLTFKRVKIILIIPDLPDYMFLNQSPLKLFFLTLSSRLSNLLIKLFDGYIFLTTYMKDYLNIKNKPYRIIETIIDTSMNFKKHKVLQENKRYIIYSGTLSAKYGIKKLLESFSFISDKNLYLLIFGDGELKQSVIHFSNENKNIIYKGSVNKNILFKEYQKATLFINPRENDVFTKYSFPSKISEYLLFGKPILCFKLNGIPEEYDEYLFYFKSNEPSLMAKEIVNLCYLKDTVKKGIEKKYRKFVKNFKGISTQSKKIKSLIDEIEEN